MKFLLFAYLIVSLFAGVSGWINAGWFIGVAGIAAPLLATWAGSGLRGSMISGERSQKMFGVVMAVIFMGIAHWLVATTDYRVGLFGVSIGGGVWYVLGAIFGFLATSSKHIVPHDLPSTS
jgi:hypothetical protein